MSADPSPSPERPHAPISWEELAGKQPPPRRWIVPHWIPAEHVTLLAGRGGIGKTLLAQHLSSAIALGRQYLEQIEAVRVLMWAGEDDATELWRRQIAISAHLDSTLPDLTERFYLHSFCGEEMTLAAPAFGVLEPTGLMAQLRAQVADYRAELVVLDNLARIFGGMENDRYQVTTFLAWLRAACAPAAVLLLGHPSKAADSEFSGSTAWEGAVRARLYLSDRPPDAPAAELDAVDDSVRYLSRRKANYSALDMRRLRMSEGVLVPDALQPELIGRPSGEFLKDIVRRAVRKLAGMGIHGTASTSSPNYLPKLARHYTLLENATEKTFANAMRELQKDGELLSQGVGFYPNRNPKTGLVLK